MGKSTHPFVMRMNEHKALHRAMRAGEEQGETTPDAEQDEPKGKRTVQLKKKNAAPMKGILTAVVK